MFNSMGKKEIMKTLRLLLLPWTYDLRMHLYSKIPERLETHLDIDKAVPFIVPLTEMAINIGMIHFTGPSV